MALVCLSLYAVPSFLGSNSQDAAAESPDDAADVNEKVPCEGWQKPDFALFVTGRQHGYIEPCGCTGLDQAKGGISRRHTLLKSLEKRGWDIVCVDVGNQVRRVGAQAEIKFRTTADLMRIMGYTAVGFGPDDLKLSAVELASAIDPEMTDTTPFISANASIAELHPKFKVVEAGGHRIGITSVIGKGTPGKIESDLVTCEEIVPALREVVGKLRSENCDKLVLLAHCDDEETAALAKQFPMFDVIVTASSAGEPTLEPGRVEGSRAQIVQAGTKGIYVGVIGIYGGEIKYDRITLDNRFADSPEVLERFATYQQQLRDVGLEGLGLRPVRHSRSKRDDERSFVGHETCGECHTTAYDIFKESPHYHATIAISEPNERASIARHHDPECLSCHVTGWNPQGYFPYKSGYLSLEGSVALHTNGCENCHGPGSAHAAAENGDMDATEAQIEKFREEMRLTLEEAQKNTCVECHDQDNSPEFDFETYWPEVEHHGMD